MGESGLLSTCFLRIKVLNSLVRNKVTDKLFDHN